MKMNNELKEQMEGLINEKANEIAAEIIGQKVNDITELLKVQRNVSVDAYMIGMYNGMELCKSILTGEEPVYLCQDEETGEIIESVRVKEVHESEDSGQ